MTKHRVDLISLAFGLIFLALGGLFVTGTVDAADLGTGWIAPGVLLCAGVLVGAFTLNRRTAATGEDSDDSSESDVVHDD